jgi:CheY-like chemotaxis protein
LIADDNEYNLIVATDTLKLKADVSILTATNGKEAIALLQENDFDVILMDVQMPEWNGFESTQYIRSQFASPKNDIPIIALTASVLRTDLDKCRQAGMNSYIAKPFTASQLINGIVEVLNK